MTRVLEGIDVLALLDATTRVRLDTASVSARASFGVASGEGRAFAEVTGMAYTLAPPLVDVPAEGLAFPFDWGPAITGADRVELTPLTLEVQADAAPDFAGYALGELGARAENGEVIVSVPAGRLIRALHLADLTSEEVTLASQQQLTDAGRRLIVRTRDASGAWGAPVVAVRPIDAQGAVPATLTGASFDNGVLRLPDLAGPVRLAVVENDSPADFAVHPATVAAVTGWAAPTPVDLTLLAPDGATLWAFPGPMPASVGQTLDVSVAVAAAVEKLRASGSQISGSLRLSSRYPCKVRVRLSDVAGALVRTIPGATKVELAGEAIVLPLATPLPPATPASVIADVRVTYRGRRLADVSDAMPASGTNQGAVVRQDRVVRPLPPLALRGETVSRIGLVGSCPEPTTLLVRLIADAGGTAGSAAGRALGTPGTANVDASIGVGVVWIDLPDPIRIDVPAAIEVSAGSGRFHWIADPDPLVRIVVLDPDPGGRPVVLGGAALLTLDEPMLGAVRAALAPSAFAGQSPLVASALFCEVEITDVELRYPRGR